MTKKSPAPGEKRAEKSEVVPVAKVRYDFLSAFQHMLDGKRIRRDHSEWPEDVYGYVRDGRVTIHRDNRDRDWIITDGDYGNEDWVIL